MRGPPDVNRIDRHLCQAALVIYGPSISSGGRGVERAKFPRNTLHSAGADANLAGNFEDALPRPQLILDSFFQGLGDLRPPELLTQFDGPLKAGIDSLPDHAALEFGKGTRHLKHELAGRRGRVDRLLI
jgi:hypothetical protein